MKALTLEVVDNDEVLTLEVVGSEVGSCEAVEAVEAV